MKISNDDVHYLNGLLDAFEGFSDGAWMQACQDAIHDCGRFKGKDPYEVWLAWVRATGVEAKP